MKKIFILLFFAGNMFVLQAQTITTQTLNATGSSSTSGTLQLDWSVGEMVAVQTLAAPTLLLTQGLLQPMIGLAPVAPANNSIIFGLYPNPATNIIILSTSGDHSELSISILNILGQRLSHKTLLFNTSLTMDISYLPKGVYVIQVIEISSHKKWSAKFIKQ